MSTQWQHKKGSLLILMVSFLMVVVILVYPVQAIGFDLSTKSLTRAESLAKIAPEVTDALSTLSEDDMMTVIITLKNQADLTQINAHDRTNRLNQVITALQHHANSAQKRLLALLKEYQREGLVADIEPFWVFNGLAVTAKAEVIKELAGEPEIAAISPNDIHIQLAAQESGSPPEANISVINAPQLWDLGFHGENIVVANMDTGVYKDHPDLVSHWRGGSNSWFDPYGEHPLTPVDYNGHGTWTMGVMVGGGAGGTAIGVAPAAQWIAVKIFDDIGQATAAGIHAGFQWLLDPDGDPSTADAPDVVNNSWTFSSAGCDLEFQQDLLSLRAAGILPVFAAGNSGPSPDTSRSPANNPGAIAVGATDNSDVIYFQSSRGPSSCNGQAVYPELVAPGVTIRTTDNSGYYYTPTGASLAAPHVAGALALLLSANPDLTADEQENALINGAFDLGNPGPDNDFGYGRLDILAAHDWLAANYTPGPTPVPVTNLALGGTATVSSAKDGSHSSLMAIDGDDTTEWQTKKVSGRRSSNSEWLEVDLGQTATINRVVLQWDVNFATAYTIESSVDGSSWSSLFSTQNGDGGTDSIAFNDISARYVRMNSSSWNDPSFRNWLWEFEIYGTGQTPPPAGTPTPTPEATPPATSTMHLGGLIGSSRAVGKNWSATVSVVVDDGNEIPLAGATVFGFWSGANNGSASCVTGENGGCSLSSGRITGQETYIIFSVDQVALTSYSYQEADNHDSGNGTIQIDKP